MRRTISGMRGRAALTLAAGATAFIALAGSPATAVAPTFCGASRGPTEAFALYNAIGDAQGSAWDMGFSGECTFAEPPKTKEYFNDPLFGHFWSASVIMFCAR